MHFLAFLRTKDRGAGLNVSFCLLRVGVLTLVLVDWLVDWLQERREGRGCRYLILSGSWDHVDREKKRRKIPI